MNAATKGVRLARALARDGLRYPALRQRPNVRTPEEALGEIGVHVPADHLQAYERAAAELLPELARRARGAGLATIADKLERPDLDTHTGKRLLYLLVRATGARVVYETGTFNGVLTTFLLRALADAGEGRLVSFDLPAREPIPHATDVALPAGREPGWIVPDELRDRLELVTGDTRETLPRALAAEREPLDVFFHDSLHTTRHMLFEFRLGWRSLRPGGFLGSDDVFDTPAYWLFTKRRRLPFVHVGNVALVRRPS